MRLFIETAFFNRILNMISSNHATYRASHIILDYLQSLTPKYAHKTQKSSIIALLNFKNDSFFVNSDLSAWIIGNLIEYSLRDSLGPS